MKSCSDGKAPLHCGAGKKTSKFRNREKKSPGIADIASVGSAPLQPLPTLQRTLSHYMDRREQCLYFWNVSFFPRFLSIVHGEEKQGQLDPINSSRYKEAKFGWGDLFLVKEVMLFSD